MDFERVTGIYWFNQNLFTMCIELNQRVENKRNCARKRTSILVSNPSFLNLISLQLNHKFFGLKTSTKIWEIYKFWNCLFYTMLFLHNIKFDLERKYMQKNEPKAIVFWLFFLILSLRIKILQSLMKANFYRVQFRNVESSQ